MPLSQKTLKTNLLSLFTAMKNAPVSEAGYADQLATIIGSGSLS